MTAATLSLFERTDTREMRGLASEIKFLVTPAVARDIRAWARVRLSADPHGEGAGGDEYRTTSLYFDTPALDVYERRGSYGRAKYRVRRYGAAEVVFLERKMRTSALLAKRRSCIALDDLSLLDEPRVEGQWAGEWFQRRIQARRLSPACQVSYVRTARVAATADGPARLTLDEGLRALPASDLAFCAPGGRAVLEHRVILELKYRATVPTLFKHLIEEFALAPQPISKYRLALGTLRGVLEPGLEPAASAGERLAVA
jgi:hypothetical protein